MSKSQRLKPIVKVAQDNEKKAAKLLAESQKVSIDRQARLDELKSYRSYRDDYQLRFNGAETTSRSAYQLRDFRIFLDRLDKVIDQQQRLVTLSLQDLERKKQSWMEQNSKFKALGKAVSRFRDGELAAENLKEQRELDERSQRTSHSFANFIEEE